MKKIFDILQDVWMVLALVIFFGFSPTLLYTLAANYPKIYGIIFAWMTAIGSGLLFLLMFWYITAKWNVRHRGYLIALFFASFFGLIVHGSALLFVYSLMDLEVHNAIAQASKILFFGILYGFCVEWLTEPHKGEFGG